jgi:hypothetical protein
LVDTRFVLIASFGATRSSESNKKQAQVLMVNLRLVVNMLVGELYLYRHFIPLSSRRILGLLNKRENTATLLTKTRLVIAPIHLPQDYFTLLGKPGQLHYKLGLQPVLFVRKETLLLQNFTKAAL